jgi:hypothetical protein
MDEIKTLPPSDGLRKAIEALALNLDRGDSIDRGIAADLRRMLTEHTAATVEKRVRFIFKDQVALPGRYSEYTHSGDGWFSDDENGAAAYPWLMNNCIVWVEERIVYDPEPWGPADIDRLIEKENS